MAFDLGGGGGRTRKPVSRVKRPTTGGPGNPGSMFAGQEARDYAQHVSRLNQDAMAAYQQQLLDAAMSAQQGAMGGGAGGGSGGGGGGGGGFGGGGGYVDRFAGVRKQLESTLNQQRDAARGALPGFLSEFNTSVGKIGADNQALTGQYSAQIQALMRQLQGQAQGAVSNLGGDLRAQGAGLGALQGQADQALLGINNIATAQDVYNQRLAQIMAQSQADRLAAGASVNQAANSQLDNAYMQALLQIQGMR